MNFSYTDHVGDGSTISFPFSFVGPSPGYLSQSHIKVYVNDILRNHSLTGTNQVTITPAPAIGSLVRIRRVVPKSSTYADFSRGNNFTGPLLNNTFLQQLYAYHEFLDGFVDEFPFILKGPLSVPSISGLSKATSNGQPVEYSQLIELYDVLNSYSTGSVLAAALLAGTAPIGEVTSGEVSDLTKSIVVFSKAAWGADPTGVLDNTTAFNNAYSYAKTVGGKLYIPAGTYKGQFLVNAEAPVEGAGARRTVLTPVSTGYTMKVFGNTGDANLGARVSGLSLKGSGLIGAGLYCGDPSGAGFSNGHISHLEISGFSSNIFVAQSIVCELSHVWAHDGVYGLNLDNERNVTTLLVTSCRFTTNDYNCKMASGHVVTFISTAFESAKYRNLWTYTGTTSGPTKVLFLGCWFEDITVSGANLYFDMDPAIAATKGIDIKFDRCAISTPNGIPDINAQNAQDVVFDNCSFSATPDGFTAAKFVYATGGNSVRILLKDCGTVQVSPTAAMYANMPALTRVSGGVFGFRYELVERNGKRSDNFRTLRISTDATSLQVAYVETLVVDTSSGNVSINSLLGGFTGQQISVVKKSNLNNLNIRNNGTGTEKILTPAGTDTVLTGRSCYRLTCVDSEWFNA